MSELLIEGAENFIHSLTRTKHESSRTFTKILRCTENKKHQSKFQISFEISRADFVYFLSTQKKNDFIRQILKLFEEMFLVPKTEVK